MKWHLFIASLLLTSALAAPSRAEPSSAAYVKRFETQTCPDGHPLQAPIDGEPEKAMELATTLYQIAGPKIGCLFVEPCFLLCLGDLRPYAAGDGYMVDPGPEDQVALDKLNAYLIPRGYSVHPHGANADGQIPTFSLRSLRGLERRTQSTKLSWVPAYDRATGWNGYYDWKDATYARLPNDQFAFDRVEGIMLGYPDAAVDGYHELVWDGWPTTVEAYIPDAYFNFCGAPVFNLSFRQASNAGVVETESSWQSFLSQAYAGPTNQKLMADPAFQAARVRRQAAIDGKPLFEGDPRFGESRRLGLTVKSAPVALSTRQERWLSENSVQAIQALRDSPELGAVAKLGASAEVIDQHVWKWILRGSAGSDPTSVALFEAFVTHNSPGFEQMYRRELGRRAQAIVARESSQDPAWDGQALTQMLDSPYCRQHLPTFPVEEQQAVRAAIVARAGYPPLGRLMAEAQSGQGHYAGLFRLPASSAQ